MRYRLVNQNDSEISFCLNGKTWFRILALADAYGWQPLRILPDFWVDGRINSRMSSPTGNPSHLIIEGTGPNLILLEEALRLADALEAAFLEYVPQLIPAYDIPELTDAQPSMGVVSMLIDFCQQGAFWVESF